MSALPLLQRRETNEIAIKFRTKIKFLNIQWNFIETTAKWEYVCDRRNIYSLLMKRLYIWDAKQEPVLIGNATEVDIDVD